MNKQRSRAAAILLTLGLGLILLAALSHAEEVEDSDLPGTGWWVGIIVQNAGGTPATINLAAIGAPTPATPTVTPTPMAALGYQYTTDPVSPSHAVIYLPSDFFGLSASLTGSGFVNLLEPLKTIVNLTNRAAGGYGVAGGLAAAAYEGPEFSAATEVLYFPTAKKAYGPTGPDRRKTSLFVVQNAGIESTQVDATFLCPTEDPDEYKEYTAQTNWLWPGAMAVIEMPEDVPADPGSLCWATMTADQPIAGVAIEYFTAQKDSGDPATLLQAATGFTQGDAYSTFYVPVFKNKYPYLATPPAEYPKNRSTGVTVVNVSGEDIWLTATVYYVSGSAECTAGDTTEAEVKIPSHGFVVFLHPAEKDGWSADMPLGCLGAAEFSAAVEGSGVPRFVIAASESFLYPNPTPAWQSAATFNGVPGSQVAPVVFVPIFKEMFNNRTSGLTVQNTTGNTASCHVIFMNSEGTYTTAYQTVEPHLAASYSLVSTQAIWTSTPMPGTGAVYSARVECDRAVAAAVSEASYYATPGDPPSGVYCWGSTPVPCYDRSMYTGFNATYTPTPTPTPTG